MFVEGERGIKTEKELVQHAVYAKTYTLLFMIFLLSKRHFSYTSHSIDAVS